MAEDVKSKMNNNPSLVPSPWSRKTVADGSWMQNYTLKPLSSRDDFLADEISGVQYSIDLLKAANDVICVYGTYDEFTGNSGNLTQLSDNDFIKVLRDNHYQPDESDPDYNTNDDDKYQVYYEYHISAHDGWDGWSAIGSLDPYYSCDEIDDIVEELSSTIQEEYIPWSAQEGIVGEDNEFASNDVTAAWAFGKGNTANYTSLTVGQTNSASYGGSIGQDNKSNYGFAVGTNNTANSYSLAVGSTNSSYQDSLTIGISNSANLYAGAIGNHVSAGNQAFSVGDNTTAYQNSLAIGSNVSANTNTFSIGIQTSGSNYSIAVGSNVKAKDNSIAIGTNISSNSASIANGVDTSANVNAGAIGNSASAFTNSFSVGEKTYANATALAIGKQASADTRSIAVGETTKSDLDSIAVGWLASSYSSSIANGQQASAKDNSLAVGTSAQALDNSLAVGFGYSRIYEGEEFGQIATNNSLNVGLNWSADDRTCLIGEGNSATTTDGGTARLSFAQGSYNRVVEMSMAQGTSNKADYRSFAQGNTNSAYSNSIAQGASNTANANSIAQGTNNSAYSDSIAQGNGCTANDNSQAFGRGNIINNSGTVFGAYNKTSSNIAFVIGNGTGDEAENRSDLFLIDKNGGVSSNSFSGVSGIFENISATNISASIKLSAESATIKNATITNVTGTTAKFDGFSGTNISASDGSTTATIKNLIDSANSGRKAFDVVNSAKFSANNTEVGYLSAGLILSSKSPNYLAVTNESNNTIGLSSNGMTGLNIIAENASKTLSSDYNGLKFIGFDLTANPAGIELGLDTSRFVMRDDVNLYIGSTGTLKAETNATALGFYTTATDASFAVGTMNNSTYKTSATIGSIALGHNNSANNYSITIGSDNSANNYSYIIGNNNKITGTGPGYILGVGNTADNGLCVLGAYAKASHDMGDLLALGFGDPNRKRDALLVNQGYVKLFGNLIYDEDEGEWVEPNIMITPNAISSTFSKKIYHFSEIQGYNLEDTDNPLKSFNDVASNNMLIMGKSPRDNSYDSRYFAIYLNPEENGLKNLSHSFKNISIAQNQVNQGYYGIRYGIANEYAVILKGFNPANCQRAGTNPDPADWTNCEYKYGNTKSATWTGNAGTKLQTSFFYKEKNYIPAGYSTAPDMFYLKIDRIALDQVVETIIDSKQKLFIMIKGDGN